MSFKKLLVPIAGTPDDASALDLGFHLARQFKAHIDVLCAASASTQISSNDEFDSASVHQIVRSAERTAPQINKARTLFSNRFEAAQMNPAPAADLSARLLELSGAEADLIAKNGRVADMIIFAYPGSCDPWPSISVQTAIQQTGCPVLLVPSGIGQLGNRVVIAWNGAIEVTRAIRFAMPILKASTQTIVITVNEHDDLVPSGSDVVDYLDYHGVKAENVQLPLQHSTASATLLAESLSREADLIVQGAFTRYRTGRHSFGSMTEFMIRQTQIPVLMVH